MKICLIALDDTYGNICGVAAALSDHADVTCVLGKRSAKKMYRQFPDHKVGFRKIPKNQDVYIVVAGITVMKTHWDFNKPTILILTDTRYILEKEFINEQSKKAIATFAMPDLYRYRDGLPTKMFYQPFKIDIPIKKDDEMFITHSPFHPTRLPFKGTAFIEKILIGLPYKYDVIMMKTWQETLDIKARSHIFIDQVLVNKVRNSIGVGKSGLEAMLLKNLVITEGYFPESDIPAPPLVFTNPYKLPGDLLYYIFNTEERAKIIQKQYEWASKYTSYDFVGGRIMDAINEYLEKTYIDPYLFFDHNKLSEDKVFVEVGSITGEHAMNLKHEYPGSAVIVYEASRSACKGLKNKIKVINKIVSGKDGESFFYEYNNNSSNSIYKRRGNKVTNKYNLETVSVESILLENNLDHIDVLFLNCEGAEIGILNNIIDNVLSEYVNQISVSFHPQIYGKSKMRKMIKKVKKAGLECVTDNGKYFNYLIWER